MPNPAPNLKIPATLEVVQIHFRDRDYRYPASITNERNTTMSASPGGGFFDSLGKGVVVLLALLLIVAILGSLGSCNLRVTTNPGFSALTGDSNSLDGKEIPSCVKTQNLGKDSNGVLQTPMDFSAC